jgi:succinyl-CoA synthetase beta subunit
MLGQRLVTPQTGPTGRFVRWVFVEESIAAARDLYAAVSVDRTQGRLVLLVSSRGGDDVELNLLKDPGALLQIPITLHGTEVAADFRAAASALGVEREALSAGQDILRGLAQAAVALDATLIEINPLALTHDGRLLALDAKAILDDNALFRHAELAKLRDVSGLEEGDPAELEAQRHHINYMALDWRWQLSTWSSMPAGARRTSWTSGPRRRASMWPTAST